MSTGVVIAVETKIFPGIHFFHFNFLIKIIINYVEFYFSIDFPNVQTQ